MKKLLTFLLTALLAFGVGWAETVDDVLNQAFTGVTGTSYSNWSGKTGDSGAVYAGNSAGGNSSIQLRSKNSNSGIVTTTSGGTARTITVTWNSNTANTGTLDIYGKRSAYSAATDLYSSSSQGAKLGSIVKGNATTGAFTISGDYEYIGLRSNSGAIYLTSITITWESGGVTPPTQVSTITAAEGLAASTNFEFTGNAVVTYQNGNNLWIRDASGSGLIYGSVNGTFANGDVLTAGWTATNTTSTQGVPQFESPSDVASSTNSGTAAPEALTTLSTADVNKYASISNITITRSSGSNYYYEVNGNEYCVRNHFGSVTLSVGKTYNVVGVVSIYNSAPQLYLISATEVLNPYLTVSPNPMTINDTDNTLTITGENITGNINASLANSTEWYLTSNQFSNTGGTTNVVYNGRALSASNTVSVSANDVQNIDVPVNYLADLYIVTDNGQTGNWNFNTGTAMTYNNGVYTASFTANADNTFILFARKLGTGVGWNTRYVFGPSSDGDWWLPISGNGNGNIDLNDDDPIKIQTAGTYIITIDATGSTVTFNITKEAASEGDFVLVTDATNLVAGNEVIIVNSGTAGSARTMGQRNSNNYYGTDVTISSTLKVTPTNDTQIFTLEQGTGGWYFKTSDDLYLNNMNSGNSNYLQTKEKDANGTGTSLAVITIDGSDKAAKIEFQGSGSRKILQYNPNGIASNPSANDIFSCYGGTQQDVFIYQRAGSTEPSITVNPASLELVIPAGGTSVNGTVAVTESNTTGTTSVAISGTGANYFSATLTNGTLTVTYSGTATQSNPDQATITLTNGTASATVTVTGYKEPLTVTITPADGHNFSTNTVTGSIESNVAGATIEYSFDGNTWYTYDANNGFTTPEVSNIGGTVTVYARATYNNETANAQATYTRVDASPTLFTKVISGDQIQDGLQYILVHEEGPDALNNFTSNATGGTGVRVAWQDVDIDIADTDAIVFTLEGNASEAKFFYNNDIYLGRSGNNGLANNSETVWVLVKDSDNGGYYLAVGTASNAYRLRYNAGMAGTDKFRCYANNTGDGVYLYVQGEAGLATPVISPASGTFTEDQEVRITCTTQDATIYYTINGGEPEVYTLPFNVDLDEEHPSVTIVAWAEKDGETSNQATVTYTFKSDKVYSIAEFLALDNGEEVTFESPVTVLFDYSQGTPGVTENGQEYIWVKDRTGYTQFFLTPAIDHTDFVPKYENGDVIPKGFKVKKNYYNTGGYYQGFCSGDSINTFTTSTSKALADPEQVTLSELLAHAANYNDRYLYINKLKVTGFIDGYGQSSGKWTFYFETDEDGTTVVGGSAIVGYNKYNSPAWKNKQGTTVGVTVPTDGNYYNVKFIFQKWSGGYEIMPIEFIPWQENKVRLEDLVEEGELNEQYIITNPLIVAKVTWDDTKGKFAIFAKDDEMYANKRDPGNLKSYVIEYEKGDFINTLPQENYDQSNWVEILIPDTINTPPITSKNVDQAVYNATLGALQDTYENKILAGGTINGTYVDDFNPTILMNRAPVPSSASTYDPNIYCTGNFLISNLGENGATSGRTDEYGGNYFMMDAKPQEFCKVVWAYFEGTDDYFVAPRREGDDINGLDFKGGFLTNMSLCEEWGVTADSHAENLFKASNDESYGNEEALYSFNAIVRKNSASAYWQSSGGNGAPRRIWPKDDGAREDTPAYIVYPLKSGDNTEVVTAVEDVKGSKAVDSIRYYNLMGQESKSPFEGINIVVTRYTDGSSSTAKVLR